MTDAITPEQFHADAPAEWQATPEAARASYATGSFAVGLSFANEIGRRADALDHHPDLLLTYPRVEVRLSSHDIGGLSRRDTELARAISDAAGELGISPATD